MRMPLICAAAALLLGGCGDGEKAGAPLTSGDITKLESARLKFLNYCGERKANGADEQQPVPPPIRAAVDDTIAVLKAHRDRSFDFRGQSTTVEAFVRDQRETLHECSDQQELRVSAALAG